MRATLPVLLLLLASLQASFAASLAGESPVRFPRTADGGFGIIALVGTDRPSPWHQPHPLQLEIVAADGSSHWIRKGYDLVNTPLVGHATGVITTAGGARLSVADQYGVAEGGGFTVNRTVSVLDGGDGEVEVGFGSKFSIGSDVPLRGLEVFIPGIWYGNRSQEATPPGALAGDVDAAAILVREDRLPLPMVAAWDPGGSSPAISLSHEHPDGSTFIGDGGAQRIIDSRLQVGSVGVLQRQQPLASELAFMFPGSEGSRTYMGGRGQHNGWANRSHPLRTGAGHHSYSLRLSLHSSSSSSSFAAVVEASWRSAFAHASPKAPVADMDRVFRASMELLDSISQNYHGTPSVPFATSVRCVALLAIEASSCFL